MDKPQKASQVTGTAIDNPYQYTPSRLAKDKRDLKITLRQFFTFSRLQYKILRDAAFKTNLGIKYKCNNCKHLYLKGSVEIDHIEEVSKFVHQTESLQAYAHQLIMQFFDLNNLQVLCKQCHRKKTSNINDL